MLRKQKNQPSNRRPLGKSRPGKTAFSYYASRSPADGKNGRIKKEVRKSLKWQLVPSFIAFFLIAASLVYASILDPNPRLSVEETASAAILSDHSVYIAAAQGYLKESIFSRSKLLVDTKTIESKLLEEFPELRSATITIPLTGRRPILTLKAADPRLLLTTTDGNYIIDSAGWAVLKVADTELSSQLGLPTVQDATSLEINIGQVALTAREAAFISELNHQLAAKAVAIDSIILPPLANELHLRPTGQPYFVKFNMLEDARQQAGAFLATQARLERDGLRATEYIDVRVEEKAFFK